MKDTLSNNLFAWNEAIIIWIWIHMSYIKVIRLKLHTNLKKCTWAIFILIIGRRE